MYFHKPAKQYQYLFEFYCHYVDWYSMVNNSNLHCSTNGSLLKHGSFAHIFFHRLKSLRENKGRTTVFFKVKSFCRAFSSHTHGKQSLSCATADTRQTKATDDVPGGDDVERPLQCAAVETHEKQNKKINTGRGLPTASHHHYCHRRLLATTTTATTAGWPPPPLPTPPCTTIFTAASKHHHWHR
jgi:hypothetical protein